MNKIIIVGGGKGGVGKSMVTIGVVDLLLSTGNNVLLVESDESNPDVYKAFNGLDNKSINALVKSEICNLDYEEGYIRLGNLIEETDAYVVVNTAARATNGLLKYGGIVVDTARALKRDVIMLWPINRQRDSLELLSDFMGAAEGYQGVYVVKNTYFGEPSKFVRYDNSKMKARVTGTVTFPELNDVLSDKLNDQRWALSNAQGLSIAERSVLQRYRNVIREGLAGILGTAP